MNLAASLLASLATHGVAVSEPSATSWLLRQVPCNGFNKPHTNLLVLDNHGKFQAHVDDNLTYEGQDRQIADAFLNRDTKQGWRCLRLAPPSNDRGELLERVLRDILHSPVAQAAPSAAGGRAPREGAAPEAPLGPTLRMAGRELDLTVAPSADTALFPDTVDAVVACRRGGRMPVLWGAFPCRQAAILYTAARQLAAGDGPCRVLDICCPVVAAGNASADQLDAAFNMMLIEARAAGAGLCLLRELDVLLSASRTAAAVLLDALATWRVPFLGGVVGPQALARLAAAHPDIRARLAPIRVRQPAESAVREAVSRVFAEAGLEDAGGLTLRAIQRSMAGGRADDPARALDVARTLAAELSRAGRRLLYPDDVGVAGDFCWADVNPVDETNNKDKGGP